MGKTIQFGLGFVTGRPNVCKVINNTYEQLVNQFKDLDDKVELTAFVLFDLGYQYTTRVDFYGLMPNVYKDIKIKYITPEDIEEMKKRLIGRERLTKEEAELFFGHGHAKGRNTLMYYALLRGMDYLLFWDDDEYPVACIKDEGAKVVLGLDDILNESINGSGYNEEFGLLGSNFASESKLKLFPRDGEEFVNAVQKKLVDKYNKEIEVMIYGDGAFKDPVGKIWELADPVVSPAHTKGLAGTPSELKIKYIADTDLKDMNTEEATAAMKEKINHKNKDLVGTDETLGTTPRRITDLLGSLCDLTSGSGDKGTPVILIQGYFDNFATE